MSDRHSFSLDNFYVGSDNVRCPTIILSIAYRKDLSWLHFDDESRVQEKQRVKDQQSCISVFVVYSTNPTLFHAKLYGRFIEI